MPVVINRAPVLTLWGAVVAERLGHPADTALTLGRAVAGSSARIAASARLAAEHAMAPVFLLGKTIQLLPDAAGELRAAMRPTGTADVYVPANPSAVQRYLVNAFGDHLAIVRTAMEELASRYDPVELNRIGFRLYEKFRPEISSRNEGWGARSALQVEKILAAV